MNKEIEIKFLNINKNEIRLLLEKKGYTLLKKEFLMKRITFHNNYTDKNDWFRLRTDGEKITLAYKCIHSHSLSGVEEIEVVLSDFDSSLEILKKTGLTKSSYQENYREIWGKKDIEVCIDSWPGISPYIELETNNESDLIKAIKELGFDKNNGFYGGVEVIYEKELGILKKDFIKIPEITFLKIPK